MPSTARGGAVGEGVNVDVGRDAGRVGGGATRAARAAARPPPMQPAPASREPPPVHDRAFVYREIQSTTVTDSRHAALRGTPGPRGLTGRRRGRSIRP